MIESSAHSFAMNSVACFVGLMPCSVLLCPPPTSTVKWLPLPPSVPREADAQFVCEGMVYPFWRLFSLPSSAQLSSPHQLATLLLKTCLRERGERGRTASTEPSSVVCEAGERQREPSPGSRRLSRKRPSSWHTVSALEKAPVVMIEIFLTDRHSWYSVAESP